MVKGYKVKSYLTGAAGEARERDIRGGGRESDRILRHQLPGQSALPSSTIARRHPAHLQDSRVFVMGLPQTQDSDVALLEEGDKTKDSTARDQMAEDRSETRVACYALWRKALNGGPLFLLQQLLPGLLP